MHARACRPRLSSRSTRPRVERLSKNNCSPYACNSCYVFMPTYAKQVAKSSAEWADSMQSLAEFSTVEDFWKVYNNVPKPSQVRHRHVYPSPLLCASCAVGSMEEGVQGEIEPGTFHSDPSPHPEILVGRPVTTETRAFPIGFSPLGGGTAVLVGSWFTSEDVTAGQE